MHTLADASTKYNLPSLAKGTTKIWYVKDQFFRDFIFGYDYKAAAKLYNGKQISVSNLSNTHILLGSVVSKEPEQIFIDLQGETWSAEGEARELVMSLGLGHMSMSVGDIIQIGDNAWICNNCGFTQIPA